MPWQSSSPTTTSKTKTFEKYDTETTVKHAWYTYLMHNRCIGLKCRCHGGICKLKAVDEE
jgi:hypothetical protein